MIKEKMRNNHRFEETKETWKLNADWILEQKKDINEKLKKAK